MTGERRTNGLSPLLLVGNILNNGYLHAKYMRRRGLAADALNVDYRHCQAQPEWAEVGITDPVEEWNQDWSKIDLKGFRRPDWFFDLALNDIPEFARWREQGDSAPAPVAAPAAEPRVPWLRQFARTALIQARMEWLLHWRHRRLSTNALARLGSSLDEARQVAERLQAEDAAFYPDAEKRLSQSDVLELLPRALPHAPLFRQYRLIHGFGLDPIYPLLANPGLPFVAYEHGTLREFPFEDSARGRLYRLAVKKAEAVVITNVDTKKSADRLGLERIVFCPHIIDDDIFRPAHSAVRDQLVRESGAEIILVHPTRHHWKNCPPGLEGSWLKGNEVFLDALARILALRPDRKILTLCFEWGQEVELSKARLRDLGIADRVRWLPMQNKPTMAHYYNAADIVIDQFNPAIGTFGGVVGEAMACAKPVLLNYRKELHRWCYPVLPPAIHAADKDALVQELLQLIDDAELRRGVGDAGRQWFLEHHSSRLVMDRLLGLYADIADRHGWEWPSRCGETAA